MQSDVLTMNEGGENCAPGKLLPFDIANYSLFVYNKQVNS
jgi:hypothetical protein